MIRQLLAEGFKPRAPAKRRQRRIRFWPHHIVTKTLRGRRRHDIARTKSAFVYRESEDLHPRVKVIPVVKVSESEGEDGNTGGLRAGCRYRIRKPGVVLKKVRYSLAEHAAPGLSAAMSVRKERMDWHARHWLRYKEARHGFKGSRRRMPATMSAVFI